MNEKTYISILFYKYCLSSIFNLILRLKKKLIYEIWFLLLSILVLLMYSYNILAKYKVQFNW